VQGGGLRDYGYWLWVQRRGARDSDSRPCLIGFVVVVVVAQRINQLINTGKHIGASEHLNHFLNEDLEFDIPFRNRGARPKDRTRITFNRALDFRA
jgi:hypothetical protein